MGRLIIGGQVRPPSSPNARVVSTNPPVTCVAYSPVSSSSMLKLTASRSEISSSNGWRIKSS
jgi:hypothetical protein